MDISKRLHEDEPFFSWRVPKWLKIISIEHSKTFPILLQQHSTSLERNVFVTRCTVINGRPGGGGLKIFLEPCMDYKIYCGLKYASYLHVILAPKSWQGIRLHPRFWEYGIHSSAVWFEMKDPCPDQPEIQLY